MTTDEPIVITREALYGRVRKSLRPKLHYIRKLKSRMLATGFPEHDRMLRDVLIAKAALKDLVAEIETFLSYRRNTGTETDLSKIF